MESVNLNPTVGPSTATDGASVDSTGKALRVRRSRQNALVVNDGHSRYYEKCARGDMYSISSAGAGQAQAAANLFSTAIASFQPIVGVFNPAASGKNLVITHAWVGVSNTANSATATGGFMWCVAQGQAITQAGTVPVSCSTFKQLGLGLTGASVAVGLVNQALTGAAGSLLVLRPVTATSMPAQGASFTIVPLEILMEEVAGSIVVPPGGVCGIGNGITGTTSTLFGGLTWEEVPV